MALQYPQGTQDWRVTGSDYYHWMDSGTTTTFRLAVDVSRAGSVIATHYPPYEEQFMTAITIDDTASVSVLPEDDHADPTADLLTWSASDGGAVVTLNVDATTHAATLVPVAEGHVDVTVSDPSAPALAPFVASFDVGPGATSQLAGTVVVNAGANTVPPPAPPAGP
jgi:hypothetical protein